MTPRRVLVLDSPDCRLRGGLVILVMSVTGVLLAYKRQIINRADRSFQSQPAPGAQRLPLEELLAAMQAAQGRMPTGITVRSESAAPVAFDFGRERTVFVNPYTGQVLGEESPRLRAFFSSGRGLCIAGWGCEAESRSRDARSPEPATSSSSFW